MRNGEKIVMENLFEKPAPHEEDTFERTLISENLLTMF